MKIPGTLDHHEKLPLTWWHRIVKICQAINGNIEFGNLGVNNYANWFANAPANTPIPGMNINGVYVWQFGMAPNVAVTLNHKLGRIPQGYIKVGVMNDNLTGSNDVYHTQSDAAAWTTNTIQLRFVNGIAILLFIF